MESYIYNIACPCVSIFPCGCTCRCLSPQICVRVYIYVYVPVGVCRLHVLPSVMNACVSVYYDTLVSPLSISFFRSFALLPHDLSLLSFFPFLSFYRSLSPGFTSFLSQFLTFSHFVHSCHSLQPMVKRSNPFRRNPVSCFRRISKTRRIFSMKRGRAWKFGKTYGRTQTGHVTIEQEARCRTRFVRFFGCISFESTFFRVQFLFSLITVLLIPSFLQPFSRSSYSVSQSFDLTRSLHCLFRRESPLEMPHGNVVRRKTVKEKTFTVVHISYTSNGKLRYNAWRNRRRSSTLENEKRAIREGTVACTGEHNFPESKRKKRLDNIRGALHDSVSRAQNFARFPFCHIFGSSIYLPTYIYIYNIFIYLYIYYFVSFFFFTSKSGSASSSNSLLGL